MKQVLAFLFAIGFLIPCISCTGSCVDFFLAAESGDVKTLKTLLRKGVPINVKAKNTRTLNRETPLMVAARAGHAEIVKILLENNADVNIRCKLLNYTALQVAASQKNNVIVEILIKHGANVDSVGESIVSLHRLSLLFPGFSLFPFHGQRVMVCSSALSVAATEGHISTLETLIRHGANIDAVDSKNMSALERAMRWGQLDAVKLLLNKGASLSFLEKTDRKLDSLKSFYFYEKLRELFNRNLCKPVGIPREFFNAVFVETLHEKPVTDLHRLNRVVCSLRGSSSLTHKNHLQDLILNSKKQRERANEYIAHTRLAVAKAMYWNTLPGKIVIFEGIDYSLQSFFDAHLRFAKLYENFKTREFIRTGEGRSRLLPIRIENQINRAQKRPQNVVPEEKRGKRMKTH